MPHRLNMFHSAITSVTSAAAFAVGVIIDEKTMIPIGTFLAVCFFVWRIASKFQEIVDRLDNISHKANRLEEVTLKFESLPCIREGICPAMTEQQAAKHAVKPLKML